MSILVTGSAGHLGEALKPHITPHTQQAFIDTNVTGTLSPLEERGVRCELLHLHEYHSRETYLADNLKVNEFLYRRADIADVVAAHILATRKARKIGFGRYIISATTPFDHGDLQQLRIDPAAVVRRHVPDFESVYARRGWTMPPGIDRVYVNERARTELEWHPTYDFTYIVRLLSRSEDYRSELARSVGSKGYHDERFAEGPYPTEKT